MLLLLALVVGIVPLVLILSAVRAPGTRRTRHREPGALQRPDLNVPEDDSREDLARYRGGR